MSSEDLGARLDAEFAAADERVKQLQSRKVDEFHGRQQRLIQFEQQLDRLRDIWRPRLQALANKFGERVEVDPNVAPGRRSAHFEFQSDLARIDLRFAVMPDSDVRKIVFTYDLRIIPILMKFDSHDSIEFPLEAVDDAALGRWIDDRIISFVRSYHALYENQYYLKDHLVQDPVAKVTFPKFAAGATLDIGGTTYYFIDDSTRSKFEQEAK